MFFDYELLQPSIQTSIEKIIRKEHFKRHEVGIKYLQTSGNNFLGKLYEVNIKGETLEGDKEVNMFIKDKIKLKNMKLMDSDQLYKNEEMIYKEFSKIIKTLQDEANVPQEVRFKLPKAYDETSNQTIILENLCKRVFETYGKTEPAPLKFIELGIQELAKFHALSFVIENKMPEFFKEKIVPLHNSLNLDEEWEAMMQNICGYVANVCEGETKSKFEKSVPMLLEKLRNYHKDKTEICTLSHGDFRTSNIMVRMNNGDPEEVIIIDYQFIDYGCAIRDLLFFIFGTTDRETRRKHLIDLKCLYFETLSSFLKYFDMDAEAVYPRREFERLFAEWLDYGLMETLFYSVVMFAPDTGIDFQNLTAAQFPYCPDKVFDPLLRGLVEDFIERGYIK